jgi:acyl-CoA thioesterase-1
MSYPRQQHELWTEAKQSGTTDKMMKHVGRRQNNSKARRWLIITATLICGGLHGVPPVVAKDKAVHIVAFGDSLIAGYGLPPGSDFASRLATVLSKKGANARITNAGVSGDTTTAGLARFDWAIAADTDAVVLELGANDGLRGIAPKIARANLDKILSKLKARNIPVLLAGMLAPANWGEKYAIQFNSMFAELATQYGALLYPFFLEGIITKPSLKLADGLHPNEAGVDEMVRRILPSVEKLIARAQAKQRE